MGHTNHSKYFIMGIISTVLMVACITGFMINIVSGGAINQSVISNERFWNTGSISMNYDSYIKGVWKSKFKHASDGFVKQEDMKISNPESNLLYADISCAVIPDNASLTLWLVQGETSKSMDVTNLVAPLEYPLKEFQEGKIHVRLQINGVKNVSSEIYIK